MTLDDLQKLCDEATPGPWVHDWGNWDVEGPERVGICSLTLTDRMHRDNVTPNEVDAHADGQFIAAARTAMPKLIKVARLAKEMNEHLDCGPVEYHDKNCAKCILEKALAALEGE